MTTKKAVELLLRQKEKLETVNLRDDTWLTQTASFIKDFFGDSSQEFLFIKDFKFYSRTMDVMSADYNTDAYIKQNSKAAVQFIDNCIGTLDHRGVYKPPKPNFLSRLNDTALWTIIGVAVPGIITIGGFFGNLYADKQNIELRQENKALRDTLSVLRPSANPITKRQPDTVIQKAVGNEPPKNSIHN